ncbi:MAG: flagellar hook protein FlgE [Defluviitaleaceae bacterium]|nr:flagellar hook protein FlgE [Defluviitaleaceae bacterium]
MMRSMFSGVSSLRLHQTRMDVIANNIANVNTDGFKAQRVTFADAFYQNLQGASGPNAEFGRTGTNPRQVGLGLNLASIDSLMHQGIARRTDNALDVSIEGGGFLIVRDSGGANLFTRAGRIERDAEWNLHIGGKQLMGWGTRPDIMVEGGHAVDRGLLVPLSITGEMRNMPSEPTTRIEIDGNLNTTQLDISPTGERYKIVPVSLYDSLGNAYVVNKRFVYHGEMSGASGAPYGYWTVEFMTSEIDPATGQPPEDGATPPAEGWPRAVEAFLNGNRQDVSYVSICLFNGVQTAGGDAYDFAGDAITSATIAFNSTGDMVGMGLTNPDGSPRLFLESERVASVEALTGDEGWVRGRQFDYKIVPVAGVNPSATFGFTRLVSDYSPGPEPATNPPIDTVRIAVGTLTFDFTSLGQRAGPGANTSISAFMIDGGGPGTLLDVSVGPDGTIRGMYSNGRDRVLGQIPLAFFANPAGLERVGNSFWRTSANSGSFNGVGTVGTMIGGALEGSNVDLAEQFVEMITTQRGFQAASRTITTSDEMLHELLSLKR